MFAVHFDIGGTLFCSDDISVPFLFEEIGAYGSFPYTIRHFDLFANDEMGLDGTHCRWDPKGA
jgi:hypothetical protein